MTDTITPCLYFAGEAEAAVDFYTWLVPDSAVTSMSRYGPDGYLPEGTALLIEFTLGGRSFQAINGPHIPRSQALSLSIVVDTQDELDRVWTALTSEGGEEGCCGWCTDRYGFAWQVVPRTLSVLHREGGLGTDRMMTALGGMKKLNVATLEAAYRGETLAVAA